MSGQKHVFNPLLGLGLDAVGDPDGISAIEDREAISKLLITVGNKQYLVPRDPYEAPKNPTMTAGNTQATAAVAQKSVTISCATSGAAIYYTTNGDDPTASSTAYNNGITLHQSAEQAVRVVTIKAVAIKNGIASDIVQQTYYISRQVATPVISKFDNNKAKITCSTAGATIYYTTDGSTPTTSSSVYDDNNKPNIAFKTIKAMAVKEEWVNSGVASKNVCYIGQAANVSSVADIYALANANTYLEDTFAVGATKHVEFPASGAQYVWFCVPTTSARQLNMKSGGVDVALLKDADTSSVTPVEVIKDGGKLIGNSYRVWRSFAQLKETWDFNFIS